MTDFNPQPTHLTDAAYIRAMKNELTREEILTFKHGWDAGGRKTDFTRICDMALAYLDTKLQDAARSLGASDKIRSVQHGNAPSPCNTLAARSQTLAEEK